jgi:hypothetical protein
MGCRSRGDEVRAVGSMHEQKKRTEMEREEMRLKTTKEMVGWGRELGWGLRCREGGVIVAYPRSYPFAVGTAEGE